MFGPQNNSFVSEVKSCIRPEASGFVFTNQSDTAVFLEKKIGK